MAFPEGVEQFRQAYREITERIGEATLTEFLSALPQDERPSARISNLAKHDARQMLLGNPLCEGYRKPCVRIYEDDFRRSLCGLVDLKKIAKREISREKERCEEWKAYQTALADELGKGTAIKPWELHLSDSIKKLEESGARTVTARFECPSRYWETKMHLDKLKEVFLKEDTFFCYGFLSEDEGDEICIEFSHAVGRYKFRRPKTHGLPNGCPAGMPVG